MHGYVEHVSRPGGGIQDFTCTSNKLRTLDLILLELGGIDLDEYAPMEPDSGIKLALKQLTAIAGLLYKRAVQCCFQGCDRLPNNGTRKERDFEEVLEMIEDLERVGRETYRGMYIPHYISFQT